jgi:hypothetical protein
VPQTLKDMKPPSRVAFLLGKTMTKKEMKAAIRTCMKKLGHVPSFSELTRSTQVTRHEVIRNYGCYSLALKACRLEKSGSGNRLEMKHLFLDWAAVVRALKKIPLLYEYLREGRYSVVPFRARLGPWPNVAEAMKLYAVEHGFASQWQDVIELIDAQSKDQADAHKAADAKILAGRPFYGQLLRPFPLVCAPVNEFGVIFLFGALAEQLGFQVLRIQGQYPDGEALRVMAENRLQRVKIEFEYESRNFLRHGHKASKCDLIVCWEHNWPDAPLEVIELRAAVSGQLAVSNQLSAVSQNQKL